MTSTTIRFNYQEAMRRASELDGIASDLDQTRHNLYGAVREAALGWKGESATQYERKGERLGEQIGESSKDLRNAANEIRRVAKVIYDTEMRNLAIAQKRDY